jgi:hypothetical protein
MKPSWCTLAARKQIKGAFVGVMNEQFNSIKMHRINNVKICVTIVKRSVVSV